MTTRSIIDIDIRTQAWDEFQSAFNKYRKAVDDAPDAWAKVDKAVKASSNPFKQISAVMRGTTEQLRQASTVQEKLRISAVGTGKIFGTMAKSTAVLAKNIKAVTLDLVRWASLTSVFSGLLGAGGLFGLDRLAQAAGTSRRESQGLGVSPGELQAARINYQKLVDVDSMLSKINEAKQDVTKRYAFAAAGLRPEDWENKNSADILKALVPQIKSTLARGDGSKQYAEATGLTQFVDLETLNRLKSVTQEEIDAAQASYEADKRTLEISDRTQRAWQDFQIQLTRAGSQIELSFIKGLTGLTGPLSKLSAAVAHAVDVFLSSPKIGEWIDKVGKALESFARYLTSDDLEHDIGSFLEAVDRFAGSLWDVAKTIGKVFNLGNEQSLKASQYRKLEELDKIDHGAAKALEHALKNPTATAENKFSWWSLSHPGNDLSDALKDANKNPQAAALIRALMDNTAATERNTAPADFTRAASGPNKFADLEKQYNLPTGLLASVEKQESGGNVNARSPVGAEGAFQFMPAAWKQYGAGGDIHNEMDSAKAAAKYYHDLLDKFQGDLPKALAGYNWGAGNVDKYGLNKAPEETRNYIDKIVADMARRNRSADMAASAPSSNGSNGSMRPTLPPAQNVAISIHKEPGADVFTIFNGMGYSN